MTDLNTLIDGIVSAGRRPLNQAFGIPMGAYDSRELFDLEVEHIFRPNWVMIGRADQVSEPNSYVSFDLAGEPLLMTRDSEGELHVFSRLCPHRGMELVEGSGKAKTLVCPYHIWSFDLGGRCKHAPYMDGNEAFRPAEQGLRKVRFEEWYGFVFVNLDGKASSLAGQYADFGRAVAPWKTEEMEVVIDLQWDCDFNWKVMIENWMESYHHMGIHHDTLQVTMPARTTWTDPEHPHFIRCHLPFRPELAEEMAEIASGAKPWTGFKPVEGLPLDRQTEWGLYLGYPCFMFLTMRDRVLWYRLEPISAGRCRLSTMTLITKEAHEDASFAEVIEAETKMLADFHAQDMQVNEAVQTGLKSAHVVRGRLSHLEEPVWLIRRYVAARAEGRHPERAA